MDKANWDAMSAREKDILVAKKVLGRKVCDRDEAIRLSNIAHPKGPCWQSFDSWYSGDFYLADGDPRFGLDRVPDYSTSRGVCGIVLNAITKCNLEIEFEDAFIDESDPPLSGADERENLWGGLRAVSDMICYCALRAVEDAE